MGNSRLVSIQFPYTVFSQYSDAHIFCFRMRRFIPTPQCVESPHTPGRPSHQPPPFLSLKWPDAVCICTTLFLASGKILRYSATSIDEISMLFGVKDYHGFLRIPPSRNNVLQCINAKTMWPKKRRPAQLLVFFLAQRSVGSKYRFRGRQLCLVNTPLHTSLQIIEDLDYSE